MEWIGTKISLLSLPKRYRYILAAILVGILLMTLPTRKDSVSEEMIAMPTVPTLEESLSGILSKISGAGCVEVLLSQEEGERTLYQTDEIINSNDVRRDTVIISASDRSEQGLIQQIIPPVYRGAVILCQGADNANVKLSVVEAVKSITGLSSDRITVLKMN